MSTLPTNQIRCGDARTALPQIPTASVDLILTDPPYLVDYRDRDGRTIANDRDADVVLSVFPELARVLKQDRYCILFCGWKEIAGFSAAWTAAGFRVAGHIIWSKSYTSSAFHTQRRHESAWLLTKGNPRKPAEPVPDVMNWRYSGNRCHPTEKSVEILTPLVRSYSRPGDLVFDPFAGSGSALVAAALTRRRYLGVELEQRYCDHAAHRLAGVQRFRDGAAA